MLYRHNIKKDSTGARILEMSYDVSEFSLFEMSGKIQKPYHYTKKIAFELKNSGYLQSECRGRYFITQKGRWFVICQRLDGLSFLSLCLLAEIYHKIKINPKLFYRLSTFRQYYEKDYDVGGGGDGGFSLPTAIYDSKSISKSFQSLRARNMVYVTFKDFIKMTRPVIDFLKIYDDDLDSLYVWCNDIFEKCVDHTLENGKLCFNMKRIFPKGTN